jgi:hypothetical protein
VVASHQEPNAFRIARAELDVHMQSIKDRKRQRPECRRLLITKGELLRRVADVWLADVIARGLVTSRNIFLATDALCLLECFVAFKH